MEEPWVSIDRVAEHLGVGKESIYRWIERRGLPATKIGKLWKLRLSEVDRWMIDAQAGALRARPSGTGRVRAQRGAIEEAGRARAAIPSGARATSQAGSGSWHVVVASSSADERAEMQRLLLEGSERRYRFTEAVTGEAVVTAVLVAEPPAACLLLDADLPDGGAERVLVELGCAEGGGPCAVVVVTGGGGEAGRAALRAGAHDFVGKSWRTAESLTRVVEHAVERVELGHRLAEMQRVEHLVDEQAQRLARLVPVAVFRALPEGAFEYVTDSWCAITGQTAAQALGEGWLQTVHAADREAVAGMLREVGAQATSTPDPPARLEFQVVRPDGHIAWVLGELTAATDAYGRRVVIGAITDISERVAAERDRARLAALVDASPDLIAQITPDGTIESWNPAGAEIFGYTSEEAVGRNVSMTVPVGKEAESAAVLSAIASSTGPRRFELTRRRKDRSLIDIELSTAPIRDRTGATEAYVACVRDVSARNRAVAALRETARVARENEHRLRLAMEVGEIGIWEWDLESNTVSWSPGCYAIHGVSAGEFTGTAAGFDQLVHPDDRARVWSAVEAAAASRTTYEAEFRIVRPSGEVRWVANRGRVLAGAGSGVRMIGAIIDITARKEAERSRPQRR